MQFNITGSYFLRGGDGYKQYVPNMQGSKADTGAV